MGERNQFLSKISNRTSSFKSRKLEIRNCLYSAHPNMNPEKYDFCEINKTDEIIDGIPSGICQNLGSLHSEVVAEEACKQIAADTSCGFKDFSGYPSSPISLMIIASFVCYWFASVLIREVIARKTFKHTLKTLNIEATRCTFSTPEQKFVASRNIV